MNKAEKKEIGKRLARTFCEIVDTDGADRIKWTGYVPGGEGYIFDGKDEVSFFFDPYIDGGSLDYTEEIALPGKKSYSPFTLDEEDPLMSMDSARRRRFSAMLVQAAKDGGHVALVEGDPHEFDTLG